MGHLNTNARKISVKDCSAHPIKNILKNDVLRNVAVHQTKVVKHVVLIQGRIRYTTCSPKTGRDMQKMLR